MDAHPDLFRILCNKVSRMWFCPLAHIVGKGARAYNAHEIVTRTLHAGAQAPALLEDLFNGMIWTSKSASTTEEGVIRVNYYVRVHVFWCHTPGLAKTP